MYECEIMGIVSARVLQLLSFSGACNVMISRGMAAPITSKFVAVHETWRHGGHGGFHGASHGNPQIRAKLVKVYKMEQL
jgi:hypothetical protein